MHLSAGEVHGQTHCADAKAFVLSKCWPVGDADLTHTYVLTFTTSDKAASLLCCLPAACSCSPTELTNAGMEKAV